MSLDLSTLTKGQTRKLNALRKVWETVFQMMHLQNG